MGRAVFMEKDMKRHAESEYSCIGAYMTVEAALLIPMVLCLFVVLLYAAWFLYDRCLFTQDAYIACLRESYRKDEGESRIDPGRIDEEMRNLAGTGYFAVSSWSGSADSEQGIGADTGTFQGTARVIPAAFGSSSLMPQNIWEMTFTARARKNDVPWAIRSFRRKTYLVKTVLQDVRGTEKEQRENSQ